MCGHFGTVPEDVDPNSLTRTSDRESDSISNVVGAAAAILSPKHAMNGRFGGLKRSQRD